MIDAKASVTAVMIAEVIPERIDALFRVLHSQCIGPSLCEQPCERLPLCLPKLYPE